MLPSFTAVLRLLQVIQSHVFVSRHCNKDPVDGEDYIVDLRKHIRRRRPFRMCLDPAFEYRCERCPDIPIYKLWQKDALMDHIRTA
jgi:hypothetical protein